MFKGFDISASALTAQSLRLSVISSNMANADVTRGKVENGELVPYRRKMTVFESVDGQKNFPAALRRSMQSQVGSGVKVSRIVEDQTPFKLVYDPEHPDAIKDVNSPQYGYVRLPNVDRATEMVDLISTTRAFEANVTVFNSHKAMAMKALEIGKS